MSDPRRKYKEGIGCIFNCYVERFMNFFTILLNEHPVVFIYSYCSALDCDNNIMFNFQGSLNNLFKCNLFVS